MNGTTPNMQLPTILYICIFFLSACTSLPHKISRESKESRSSSKAKEIISILKDQNHNLKTIKGVGRITFLENDEKEMTTRIAWVASTPDKIRITLSSVSGHPMISAASDGQWFYFFSHASGDFYKKRPTNFNMKRFFTISIKSEDIVNILFGRIPVVEYDSTDFMEDRFSKGRPGNFESTEVSSFNKDIKGNKNSSVILLKNKWGNVREKIYLNDRRDTHMIEMFDSTGAVVYRIELIEMQEIKSYRVPYRLKVSDDDGAGFQLDLDRYWADAAVSPSVFMLTPPR
jgi:starvation-inducible outer membrane lipoprotein